MSLTSYFDNDADNNNDTLFFSVDNHFDTDATIPDVFDSMGDNRSAIFPNAQTPVCTTSQRGRVVTKGGR